MLPSPVIVNEVYEKHKATWTPEEKHMAHEKLNKHGIGDGINAFDLSVTEVMCMIYVDGIRDGRS